MKNSRRQQLLDTFRVLSEVHFMHTICCFESWEVKSPTPQMVCESKLKRRSYGCLKTTASSCAKWVAKFRKVFRSCETTCKHMCATSQVETPFSQLRNELQTVLQNHLQVANLVANHLQVAESLPSCEITNSTCSKFKLAKWIIQRVNHLAKSTCAISNICNRLS